MDKCNSANLQSCIVQTQSALAVWLQALSDDLLTNSRHHVQGCNDTPPSPPCAAFVARCNHRGLCRNWQQSSRAHTSQATPWQHCGQRCSIPDMCETPGGRRLRARGGRLEDALALRGSRVVSPTDVHRVCAYLNAMLQTVVPALQAKINAMLDS